MCSIGKACLQPVCMYICIHSIGSFAVIALVVYILFRFFLLSANIYDSFEIVVNNYYIHVFYCLNSIEKT
ncbi:hypothetical protein JCM21142_104084 [Saccharicrinis fermentans DSM 9555 = JCM 21142]|uniref:Uncharacterized protein n=1 Tax=Saccharicrinis fermentans DSM 9555 = JCM 21142 TaxID=869213 RepID=W7YAH9_9BACT|nr:hypothetical protein JCM21142_104084 [Saccharicrinis fermentans DSM 9555 = JCM 21142]